MNGRLKEKMMTKQNTDKRVSDQDHLHIARRNLICHIHSGKLLLLLLLLLLFLSSGFDL